MQPENLPRGALLMLSASLVFAAASALVKQVSNDLPNEMVVFFRNLAGLLVLAPWFIGRGPRYFATRFHGNHFLRAFTGVIAMYCYFYAIGHMPLAEAVLLNYTAPLFIPLVALFWLSEAFSARLWWPILIGFAGIGLILKPGASLFTPVALIGLAAGIFSALSMVGIRRLTSTEPATRVVFYFAFYATLATAIPLIWSWKTPPANLLPLLFLVGLFSTAGQILITRAYACAPAGQVGPFLYAIVVLAGMFGWAFWSEIPDWLSLAGVALVIFAGALTIRMGGRKTAPPADAPEDATR